MIKGGVWKNTEDEILKAAVMKYGKNQWARISSLLVRKSAKQCKARWFEWLDPSIRKTEWTRVEDEKLLHLAKIMPTQWRTIAPIIGRTAAQCLEHYEKLLDSAQDRDGVGAGADDPRRLRPGEIDPNPEARPPRPDPMDMDEDEKEMLGEARARLANTKGKKAKRKARERQLEEARRLASLQKKRELRAAGIELRTHKRKRRRDIDYRTEIPFHKRAPAGFFDVGKDVERTKDFANDKELWKNKDLGELEGRRREEEEARERKKDARRERIHRRGNLPEALKHVNKLNDPQHILRRTSLSLPAPQVTDQELEQISKMGAPLTPQIHGGTGATKTLLGSYGGKTPMPTPLRTPRTPVGRDTILEEAQNLIRLTNAQTPLKGGENEELNPTSFQGMTPRTGLLATPSSMTPVRGTPSSTPSATPVRQGHATPRSVHGTPLRDDLSINPEAGMTAAVAKRANKRRKGMLAKKLAAGLAALPEATNEYQLRKPVLAKDEVLEWKKEELDVEEDAEDALSRIAQVAQELEDAQMRRRHVAIQRSLPRPVALNINMGDRGEGDNAVYSELRREMVKMIRYDAHHHPVSKKKKPNKNARPPPLPEHKDEELQEARDLVSAEAADVVVARMSGLTKEQLAKAWEQAFSQSAFLPSEKAYGQRGDVSQAEWTEALVQEYELTRGRVEQQMNKGKKMENRLKIRLGGYRSRAKKMVTSLEENHGNLVMAQEELRSFEELFSQESRGIPYRVACLDKENTTLLDNEKRLQSKYARLKSEKEALVRMLTAHKAAAVKAN